MIAQTIKNILGAQGYALKKLPPLIRDINKSRKLKSLSDRRKRLEDLKSTYKDNYLVLLEYSNLLMATNSDQFLHSLTNLFESYNNQLENYFGRSDLIYFANPNTVIGSLGNINTLVALDRAINNNIIPSAKVLVPSPAKSYFSNPTLIKIIVNSCSAIQILNEEESWFHLESMQEHIQYPLGLGFFFDEKAMFLEAGLNYIRFRELQSSHSPDALTKLQLTSELNAKGLEEIAKLGLGPDDWFVILHVRETGYRGETISNTQESWRNADVCDYIPACLKIVEAGGVVIRMGDKSMKPLPHIPNVIDYAHSPLKTALLDVYLCAKAAFALGTASGVYAVAQFFGTPCILTNTAVWSPYFGLTENDYFLPRTLYSKEKKRKLEPVESLCSPLAYANKDWHFSQRDISWSINKPIEITELTVQVLKELGLKSGTAELETISLEDQTYEDFWNIKLNGLARTLSAN